MDENIEMKSRGEKWRAKSLEADDIMIWEGFGSLGTLKKMNGS